MKNILGYSDGFGDILVEASAALVLFAGLVLCYHVVIERPLYQRRKVVR